MREERGSNDSALFMFHRSYFLNPSNVQRMAAVKLWLEMEIGITGGEEVGVGPGIVYRRVTLGKCCILHCSCTVVGLACSREELSWPCVLMGRYNPFERYVHIFQDLRKCGVQSFLLFCRLIAVVFHFLNLSCSFTSVPSFEVLISLMVRTSKSEISYQNIILTIFCPGWC